MKRVLSAILATFLFVAPAVSSSWSSVAEKSLKSTVSLQVQGETSSNFCSGIVIDNERDYVLTADHCVAAAAQRDYHFTVDGHTANTVLRDIPEDLAILRVEDLDKPAFKPSKLTLKRGDPIMALGFAYGLTEPQARISNVVYPNINLNDAWCNSECIGVAIDHIGGMSGGPVVDKDGRLAGIVQFGDGKTGFGRTIKVILEHVGKYFEHK